MTMVEALDAVPGFQFGADPELFIQHIETGEFISAGGIIPGTKDEPVKVPYGAIQQDGVAAEFNIDPVTSFEEFDRNIVSVIGSLKKHVPDGYRLVGLPSAVFTLERWDKVADYDKILGCSPDMNAWTGDVNPPPAMDGELERTRCAGGHIHIGWTENAELSDMAHLKNANELVQQLDYYLGAWSLKHDTDPTRRNLYGKAGACRVKPYGVEYRVLSNFWLRNKGTRRDAWNRLQSAIRDMRKTFRPEQGMATHQSGVTFNEALIKSINASERDSYLEKVFHFPINAISSGF